MRSSAQIKQIAKPSFKANLGVCALIFILYALISTVSSIVAFLVVPVLTVGISFSFLQVYTGQRPSVGSLFSGFEKYGRHLGSMLLVGLFTWLWSLLLVVPGIIKMFSYSMTPFILADSYDIKARAAIRLSKRITKGNKFKIFVFFLSYLGWALLCNAPSLIATAVNVLMPNQISIGSVFGMVGTLCSVLLMAFVYWPYFMTGFAGFYLELKQNAIDTQIASAGEFR